MRRTAFLLFALALVFASDAHAQFLDMNRQTPGSAPRPALSPYLNLIRGGNPAANYYLGVLPEQDRRAFQGSVLNSQSFDSLRSQPPSVESADDLIPSLPQTGHITGFQFYGNYFNTGTQFQPRSYFPYNPGQTRPLSR